MLGPMSIFILRQGRMGRGRGVAAPPLRLEGVMTPELYLLLLAVNVVFLAVNVVFQRLRFPRRPT